MNTSIKMNSPCELLNITPLNPLISKCEIKVCYVGDKPNRNKSVITKAVATEMANSLPGSPIVGYYNETTGDFEEHNKTLAIQNGQIVLKDGTRPYGFVDLNAKVWFQKYSDNGVEHEYLMTEGYLWTGQYPEAQRIISQGNNQSMELDTKTLDAAWTKDGNGKPQFFIINEAIISKLCILGDACEPCFEGAQITAPTFSLDEDFKVKMFSMMEEIKTLLEKGGSSPVNIITYAVEIGDALWCRVHDYLVEKYPDEECDYCSIYRIRGIFEEDGQKYVLLAGKGENAIYKMNFVIDGDDIIFGEELIEGTMEFVPVDGIKNEDEVKEFALQYAANHAEAAALESAPVVEFEVEEQPEEEPEVVVDPVEEPVVEEIETPVEPEEAPAVEEAPASYNLEEIPEYVELAKSYASLEKTNDELSAKIESLNNTITELSEFKKSIEKKDKQAMIDSFYMLSDEDKKDVQDNIDSYSLDDIEAKLSIICVRNRVNFSSEDNNTGSQKPAPTTYNLQHEEIENDMVPAWVAKVREVAKNKNI